MILTYLYVQRYW